MKPVGWILVTFLVSACSVDDGELTSLDPAALITPPPAPRWEPQANQPGPQLGDPCRPLDQRWVEGEPLLLPCERTEEPCDDVDNDADGFTDPHCPTKLCRSDGDCRFGGILVDADCNNWGDPYPVCNQIDGAPANAGTHACWGVLCPPGLKCFAGACITPGRGLPDEPCKSGADCPISAGCIPDSPGDDPTAICRYICEDQPCPNGYVCNPNVSIGSGGIEVTHYTCSDPFKCPGAETACVGWYDACRHLDGCVERADCLIGCTVDEGDCASCPAPTTLLDIADHAVDCMLSHCDMAQRLLGTTAE